MWIHNTGYLGQPPSSPRFRSCGAAGVPGNQGVSARWADTCVFLLGGQYFVLDRGDGQPEVPPGNYILRITVNPCFVPVGGSHAACGSATARRVSSVAPESDYANNIGSSG